MDLDYGKRNRANLKYIVVMAKTIKRLEKDFFHDFREVGLTAPQFGVLEALYHQGPLTVNELIEKNLSSSGNIAVVIDNLVKAGLVSKTTDPDDRRVRRVLLTETGGKLIAEVFPKHMETLAEFTTVLSDEELDELTELTKKLGKGRVGEENE